MKQGSAKGLSPLINSIGESAHYQQVVQWSNENIEVLESKLANIRHLLTLEVDDARFNEAINDFHFIIDKIPLMVTFIEPTYIVRARPNYNGEIFEFEHQISYNSTNTDVIQAGRFNRPKEGLFYGGLRVDNPETDYVLACSLESCKELIHPDTPPSVQDMTVGRWTVGERFPVVNFCFNGAHLSGNQVLQTATSGYLKEMGSYFNSRATAFVKDLMFFVSDLSCTAQPGNGYYILNALFYAILYYYENTYGVLPAGVIYPSAMSESKGLNIVMLPPAVDYYLKLDKVVMYRFFLVKDDKQYVSYPCSDLVDVIDNKFSISNYVQNGHSQRLNYF